MSTSLATISQDYVSVRFKTPYVSESLNQKFAGVVRGVVEGGELLAGGAPMTVMINPDVISDRSVYAYEDADNHVVMVRQPSAVTLSLAALANQTVYIALFVDYSTAAPTVATWRAYTETELFTSPISDAPYVIIVGKVDVPASGVIPDENVTADRRRDAWMFQSNKMRQWPQIIDDPSFESSDAGGLMFWEISSALDAAATVSVVTTAPRSGGNELSVVWGSANATLDVIQPKLQPVTPGMRIRLSAWFRGDSQPAGSGTWGYGPAVRFYTAAGVTISTDVLYGQTTGTFDYEEVHGYITVPATARMMSAGFVMDPGGATWSSGTLFVDDVRAWIEPGANALETEASVPLGVGTATARELVMWGDRVPGMPQRQVRVRAQDGASDVTLQMGIRNTSVKMVLELLKGAINAQRGGLFGLGLLGSATDAILARVTGYAATTGTSAYTLMMEFQIPSLGDKVRFYSSENILGASGIPGLLITVNAYYDSSTLWVKDSIASRCVALSITNSHMALYNRTAGSSLTWSDSTSDWNGPLKMEIDSGGKMSLEMTDAFIKFVGPFTTNARPTGAPIGSALYPDLVPKVWGYATTNGGGGVSGSGWNIDTITLTGGNTIIDVNYKTDESVSVFLTVPIIGSYLSQTAVCFDVVSAIAGKFRVRAFDAATGDPIDFSLATIGFSFVVMGKWTD